eukprot:96486-Prymnesium_polylepis.1
MDQVDWLRTGCGSSPDGEPSLISFVSRPSRITTMFFLSAMMTFCVWRANLAFRSLVISCVPAVLAYWPMADVVAKGGIGRLR